MKWSDLPLWEFYNEGSLYAVKVTPTAVRTLVSETYKDHNVRIEVHSTESGRLIGYTIRGLVRGRKPLRLVRPFCLGLFYSDTRMITPGGCQEVAILYHDHNVRFLAFGEEERRRDYMMVLRARA